MLSSKPRPLRLWSVPFHGGLALALAVAARAQAMDVPVYPAVEGLTEVKSLDVATEAGAIHALLVGHFTQRKGVAVAYVFSGDGGRTWSKPAFPAPADAAPPVSRRGDDARLAVRSGRIMAVWKSRSDLPGNGEIAVAVSADGGRTWRRGTNPAVGDATRNQSHFGVAADHAGDFHLIWLDDREENGNTQGLRYAKSVGGGLRWLPETTLDGNTCTCCWTRLLALPDRSLGLLFRDSNPHDMRFARLRTGQSAWTTLSTVGRFDWDFTGCPHCGGGLAASGWAGRMALHGVVWTGKEQAAGLYYLRSMDGGARWSEPLRIAGEEARESDIAARADGALGLAFVPGRAQPVQFRSSRDGGRTWSAPKALSAPGVTADHPRVVATPFGFRVFWTEARVGAGKTWAMAAPPV
jgi:hypothetical protein